MIMKGFKPYEGKFQAVLLFGPPGSGKGTQGDFLCSAGNHVHLSSGDIFRGLSPESPAGQLFYKYANRGHLLPDEITIEIWYQYVQGLIATNRYFPENQYLVLDGVPRTLAQAEMLDEYIDVKAIILLEIKHPEVLYGRLLRRGTIERRTDDVDKSILKTRMEVYEKETLNLLSHYPTQSISRFNAQQKPLEVLRDILDKLANVLSI